MWSLLGRHLMVLRIYLDGRVVVPTSDGKHKDSDLCNQEAIRTLPSKNRDSMGFNHIQPYNKYESHPHTICATYKLSKILMFPKTNSHVLRANPCKSPDVWTSPSHILGYIDIYIYICIDIYIYISYIDIYIY